MNDASPPAPLLTRWGRAVGEAPWPEYPRPQMARAEWLNLNGRWQYAIVPKAAPQPQRWDGEILVPFPAESVLSRVRRPVSPEERLWYRRTFAIPSDWRGRRVLLHFGAVDFETAVFIDRAFVGAHRGGSDPFSFDVTEYVGDGPNELVVGVWDPTNRGEQPRGKQHLRPHEIWYTAVTGIWQTVWLEPVSLDNHVEELRIVPNLALACIDVDVMAARPTRRTTIVARVSVRADGRIVASATTAVDRRTRIAIAEPRAWSPDSPFLYDVTVDLMAGDVVIDRVDGYFGMRSAGLGADEFGRPTLLLNGVAAFQLGTLDQGWWPDGLLTPPSDAAIVHELEFLKAAGFNALRKHIKVEPARYYYHCDRLGILVWQDMPSGFAPAQYVAPNVTAEGLKKSVVAEQFELELRRMVNRLSAHPSIVMWVIHNEGWGQYDTARLAEWVKAIDSTRIVDAASGWLDVGAGDVRDVHDYGEAPTEVALDRRRARVLGEYGGIGWPIDGHLWDPRTRNWGYQTYHARADVEAAYRTKTAAVIALRDAGLIGAIYTQTTDVEGEVNGLLTYDREVEKLSRAWLAAVHAPLTRR